MAPLIRLVQGKSADPEADLEEFVSGHKEENEEEDRLINRRAFIKEHNQ